MRDVFVEKINIWYKQNKRDLPWRDDTNPYNIWLSEIILQQTRIEQGLSYYQRFIKAYPDIHLLANAEINDILKLWQGLGYYGRARNLHEAAKYVVNQLKGIFPDCYSELLKMKGVGKYTAAAIASIAFNESIAALDGNVYRVLSRYFGIFNEFSTEKGKKLFFDLASKLIDQTNNPGDFNQALMDFGSLQCTPVNPNCYECPLSDTCYAKLFKKTGMLPTKKKRAIIRKRYFYYIVIIFGNYTYIRKRKEKDIWRSLYEFPLFEYKNRMSKEKLVNSFLMEELGIESSNNYIIEEISKPINHKLSHQLINAQFILLKIFKGASFQLKNDLIKIHLSDLSAYPVSRLIEKYVTTSIKFMEYINTQKHD